MLLFFIAFAELQVYKINTNSMANAIKPGNYVLVLEKGWLNSEYKINDIISFKNSDTNDAPFFVKRVVGISKDTLFADQEDLKINNKHYSFDPITYSIIDIPIYINDKSIIDFSLYFKFLLHATDSSLIKRTNLFTRSYLIVPDGFYFVIGDNYDESMDSRFWGFIDKNQIIGKVILIF